jgi:hypothetical protein
MDTKQIAWMAGLIEGEGTFSINGGSVYITKRGEHKKYKTPQIQIAMSDRDVVERVARTWKKTLRGPYDKGLGLSGLPNKPSWYTSVCGSRAIGWMMTLYPFLGERRREKVRDVVAEWRASDVVKSKRQAFCADGHKFRDDGKCAWCGRKSYPKGRAKRSAYASDNVQLAEDKSVTTGLRA